MFFFYTLISSKLRCVCSECGMFSIMASGLREADLGKCKRAAGGPGIAYSVFKIYVSRKGPLFPAEHCCVSILLAVKSEGKSYLQVTVQGDRIGDSERDRLSEASGSLACVSMLFLGSGMCGALRGAVRPPEGNRSSNSRIPYFVPGMYLSPHWIFPLTLWGRDFIPMLWMTFGKDKWLVQGQGAKKQQGHDSDLYVLGCEVCIFFFNPTLTKHV